MEAKIIVERLTGQMVRLTLTADVRVSGNLETQAGHTDLKRPAEAGRDAVPLGGARADPLELFTVEQVAEILQMGRDKVYYLIRTGQLRSIKIGKLRRVSRAWIAEFLTACLCEESAIGS